MTRIHSHRRGKSHSTRPASKSAPGWVTYSPDELSSLIVKMAKDGYKPSQIGVKLRDEHAVPLAKSITGKSIVELLEEKGLAPKVPENLNRLLSRASQLQSHLKEHKGDHKNVRSLELLEAKVHRLSKYYKRIGVLPSNWKFAAAVAQLE